MNALLNCLMSPSCLAGQLITGLTYAIFLFLIASGLSIIFGVLNIVNFAHGSLYMLGAYFAYTFTTLFISPETYWLAFIIVPFGVAGFGAFMQHFFLRPISQRYPKLAERELFHILATYGFTLLLDDLVKMVWGARFFSATLPSSLAAKVFWMGKTFPIYYFFVLGIGVVSAMVLWFWLNRTNFGRVVRAAVSNTEIVASLGVNVSTLYTKVFALGAWLGGLGGVLALPIRSASPEMGGDILFESFIVVVVGGLGSIWGALISAVMIGILRSFGILAIPSLEMVFAFVLMAIVLILRPRGILGKIW
ncbi:MAG: branched-chain amino acid ABC transporter permease [Thermodesulfobacteriota bacterium]|jgi:branched-subunit amino acid ABC-type transport system permease component